jgi:phospholipase/carboxylesterase
LASGTHDPLIPPVEAERLTALLQRAGAEITHHWERAGHQLTPADVEAARGWLSSLPAFAPGESPSAKRK